MFVIGGESKTKRPSTEYEHQGLGKGRGSLESAQGPGTLPAGSGDPAYRLQAGCPHRAVHGELVVTPTSLRRGFVTGAAFRLGWAHVQCVSRLFRLHEKVGEPRVSFAGSLGLALFPNAS